MICPQCGSENAPGDKFCEQCGTLLNASSAASEGNVAATVVGAPPSSALLVRNDDPGQTFPLGTRVVVGRLDTCDIPIHDKSVSREHARLSQLPGGYVVEDLGSTNGTAVNGERISEAVILRKGDLVKFGSVEFHFDEVPAAGAEAPGTASTQPFQYSPSEPQRASAPFPTPTTFPPPEAEPVPATEQQAPPFEFPPLQPFTPVPEPAPAEPTVPPPAPVEQESPVFIPPVAATPPPAPEASAPEPSVEAAAAPPPPPPFPVESAAASADVSAQERADTLPDDAVAAAAHLSHLVQALAEQSNDARNRHTELEDRVRELEAHASARDAISSALADAPRAAMDEEQLASAEHVLEQLSEDPRDIELLMQIGRQAGDLASIVRGYGQLRDALQRIEEANSQ